jgi:hypothetical protein
MPTIYRPNSERISVADAKQLILDAIPLELNAAQFFLKMGPDGKTILDIDMDSMAVVSAAEAHSPFLDTDFLELCKGLGFEPHMMFRPAIGGYRGPQDDSTFMLTHAQFVKLAESYSLMVEVKTASPQATLATPAPARATRRTWWEVASPYMAQVLKNGQFSTAKELYRALESKAGPDSPFDAGTGTHRGSLFVRDVALPLALKTVQNRFNDLRKLAQTSTP